MLNARKKETMEKFFWGIAIMTIVILAIKSGLKEGKKTPDEKQKIYKECIQKDIDMCAFKNGIPVEANLARTCIKKLLTQKKWRAADDICKKETGL
ncbi:MAG: hypothetical protein A3A10_02610 [Candidatus Tagabacteria bacterium RIFCSPLOWO2_01_FULL_42_9]|uniref:Uncharacterized protein n=1 Tax=Candidatus Tagabacteria bacterium RIFCSPLOWO2_01_FULL_42_9 TaxID=1802296 RepID=A0A1G2LSE8_9BACT|nr:MAG: hypothetical protein A3A10_02610 [Candidatus Tagabacteria bacterium RIFCSPLOWO2_01_FULL_42_9]